MSSVELSLILPCYNEGPTFEKSVWQVVSILKKIKRNWEIIFVEDKSTDETKKTIAKLLGQMKNSRAIFHEKNEGRGKSVVDGILASRGEICGFIDVDLEVSADYISLFIKEIENGYDMAIARRFYEISLSSIVRALFSKVYLLIVQILLGIPLRDTEAGYKFFRRLKVLQIAKRSKNRGWFWDTEICFLALKTNLRISEDPVIFIRRKDKEPNVRLIPDTIDYMRNLIRFKSQTGNKLKI